MPTLIETTVETLREMFSGHPSILATEQADMHMIRGSVSPVYVVVTFNGFKFNDRSPRPIRNKKLETPDAFRCRLQDHRRLYERERDTALKTAREILGNAGYEFREVDSDLRVKPK